MACVALSQTRSGDWIATLSVSPLCTTAQALLAPPIVAAAPLPFPDPALAAFGEAVKRVLLRNGGTISLSGLGVAIPRAQRPRHSAKMLPIVSGLTGVEVVHNRSGTAFVRLVETNSVMSLFADLVRGHLERAGGSMSLLSLSTLIPKSARPPLAPEYNYLKPLEALRILLDEAFGSDIVVGRKKKGWVTLHPQAR